MNIQSFTNGFLIVHDKDNIGKKEEWYKSGIPKEQAKEAYVPSNVHMFFPDAYGIAWYEKEFTPEFLADRKNDLVLKFETSCFITEVYLNGEFVGSHTGVEDPFEFTVSDFVKEGVNRLCIRVSKPYTEDVDGYRFDEIPHRNQLKTGIMPGTCLNIYGICGKIELVKVPKVRLTDIYLYGNMETGCIDIDFSALNNTQTETEANVSFVVSHKRSGFICAEEEIEVALPVGMSQKKLSIKVGEVNLWSDEDPFLYTVQASIKADITHRTQKNCGFREFKVGQDGFFYLNGKRKLLRCSHTGNCFLWGINMPAVNEDLWRRDFILAKAVGLNCVRFISGGATADQLDFCDEIGLMIYEEPYSSWLQQNGPRAKELYEYDLFTLIKRDRSHPCIVIWGLLNETVPTEPFNDCCIIARNCLGELREIDNTRLVLYSSGRFDGLVGVGSVSNPFSNKWECLWDGEDETSDEAVKPSPKDPGAFWRKVGDKHAYPRLPISKYDIELMRTVGQKPFFFSEYGVGSLLDTKWLLRIIEQYGIDIQSPDCAMIKKMDDQFMRDYEQYGLNECYPFPIDLLRESQRLNARQRMLCFDIMRSNPKCCGFSMTGLLDHSICGEGMWTLMREFKPGSADVFQNGMAPLKWCLFLSDSNVYSNRPFEIEAVLANEDILKAVPYTARFKIIGEHGAVWEKEITVTPTDEQLKLFSVPVLKEVICLNAPEGKYVFRAELVSGAAATDGTLPFFISEDSLTKPVNMKIGAVGVSRKVKEFLLGKGIECETVNDQKVILVGDIEEEERDSLWESIIAKAKEGAKVIAASRFALEKGEQMCYYLPLEEKPDRYPHHKGFTDWLYHKEYIAKSHPYFENLPCGKIMDWEYYMYLISGACYFGGKLPDETIVACVGPGNINPEGYEGGFNLARYNIGKGSLVVNSLNILENIALNPAADRLLVNIIRNEGN